MEAKQFLIFAVQLWKEVEKDEIIPLANDLAYKIVLAMFPFIIFLMTILGFLNIDGMLLLKELSEFVPGPILEMIEVFVTEVIDRKNLTILSTSLLLAAFSASSGMRAVMRGINKAYGQRETRGLIQQGLISILLIVVFVMSIVCSLAVLIYGDLIMRFVFDNFYFPGNKTAFWNLILFLAVLVILIMTVTVIYKWGNCKKMQWMEVLPGALVTVALWLIVSKLFNLYVNHFSNFSKVYGSIGSVFVLLIWLNMISAILLIGSEINALLAEELADSFV